jgi:tetratricopeptide (TPR) repeat protein
MKRKRTTAPVVQSKMSAASKPPGSSPSLVLGTENRYVWIAGASLLLLVAACYANGLGNGFVFDDNLLVLNDARVRSLVNLPGLVRDSYRPLRNITYAFDFAIWGDRPFGFHLTNILIHLANTLLVFSLFRRFGVDLVLAALGALIFAVHPLQPESVTYVSGRRDVLFSLFYLASLLSYLAYHKTGSRVRLIQFFGFWGLSLLSKEMAVSLPLVVYLWSFCEALDRETGPLRTRSWVAARKAFVKDKWLYTVLLVGVAVFGFYTIIIGASQRATRTRLDYWGGSFYSNALTALRVQAWYLKQLILPTPIVQYFGAFDVSTTLADWRVMVALAVVLAVLAGALLLLVRDRLMGFAVLSYFVLLLPVSQIIPHHELLADHYLYLPLMSFALFVILLAGRVAARGVAFRRVAYGVLGSAVVALAVMTVVRNTNWKNDLTLWQANYKEAPNSLRAAFNLASQNATVNPGKAAQLYRRAIELSPSFAPAYFGLAGLYQTKDKAREIEGLVISGLNLPDSEITYPDKRNPNRFRSEMKTALAVVKGNQGDYKSAEELLREAIEQYPANQNARGLLAALYHGTDPQKEIETLKQQIATSGFAYDPLRALSTRLIETRNYDDAIPYLERMLTLVPKDFYANYQLGGIYTSKHDCSSATSYLSAAQAAASSDEETRAIRDALAGLQSQCGPR